MTKKKQMTTTFVLGAIFISLLGLWTVYTYVLPRNGTVDSGLVVNGGFEDGTTPWTLATFGNTATLSVSQDAHRGISSAKVTATSVASGTGVALQQSISPVVGETYTLSFWYKASGAFMAYVSVADAGWVKIDWWKFPNDLAETNTWKQAELTVGPIPAHAHSWVSFDLDSVGEFQVDDVSIR